MKLQTILLFIPVTILEISQKNFVTGKQERNPKWSQRVIRTIKQDPRIYQIMLLTDYEKADNLEVVQELQEHLPTLYFTDFYLEQEIQQLEKRDSLSNPRDTTMFILVESSDRNSTDRIEKIMSFVKQLSTARIRPQCLIVRFLNSSQTSKYTKFLQKMWRYLFLDITVLDIIEERAVIHQLNPFFFYKTKPFSEKTSLFPDKLENLNGYPLKVAYINRPPYVTLKRNSTNYPFDITGPDSVVGHIFAEKMNYSQVLVPSESEEFGAFSCNINKMTGVCSLIQRREIHFICVTSALVRRFCKKEVIENAIFAFDHYIAVAPILLSDNYSITIGKTFYCSIVLTLLIAAVGVIIIKTLRFDRIVWNWTAICQILFGFSVGMQSKKLKERIFLTCLFAVNYYYSFHILESLTDFNFQLGKEKEVNNIDDLMKSGLQFCSEINTRAFLPGYFNQDNFTAWVKRGRLLALEECIEFLVEFKNVTCIMKLSHAEWFAGFYKENNLVKFIPEYFASVGTGFFLEPGSPYVEKFEQIHRSLKEVGLLEKWKISKIPNATRYLQLGIATKDKFHNLDDSADDWKLRSLLLGIMIVGYLSSFLLFILELMLVKWKQKFRNVGL